MPVESLKYIPTQEAFSYMQPTPVGGQGFGVSVSHFWKQKVLLILFPGETHGLLQWTH